MRQDPVDLRTAATVNVIEARIIDGFDHCKSVTEIAQDIATLLVEAQQDLPERRMTS